MADLNIQTLNKHLKVILNAKQVIHFQHKATYMKSVSNIENHKNYITFTTKRASEKTK